MNFLYKNKITFLIFICSSLLLLGLLGLEFIPITNTQWLHNGSDINQLQSGWHFFKNDSWRFPLGINPNYGGNFSNSIVFSDSIPLFALFFKLLSPILPENFQYLSIWYFLCFFLQLFFSFKIIKEFTQNDNYSLIASLFFSISPIFIYRMGWHPALAGQWILLFALYLGLTKELKKNIFTWIFLICLSSLIHFYFTVIILIVFTFLKIFNFFSKKENLISLLKDFSITLIALILVMYIVGYFEVRTVDTIALGFGSYKLNLLSIFDPTVSAKNETWSWILPDIKMSTEEELEGFNYLGLGQIIGTFVLFILYFINKKNNKLNFLKDDRFKIFLWIALALSLASLSNKISFGNYTLIEIPLNKFIYASLSIIRSSGRLFWLVNYLLIILFIIVIFKSFNLKKSFSILALLFVIQLVDISAGLKNYIKLNNFTKNINVLHDSIWEEITKNNKIIQTTRPVNYNSQLELVSYIYEKYSIKKTNLVKIARVNRSEVAKARYTLYENFRKKKIDSGVIYIVDNIGHLRNLKHIFKNEKVGFFFRDNIWLMLKNNMNNMNSSDLSHFNKIEPKLLKLNIEKKLIYEEIDNYYGFGWSHNFSKEGIWSEGKRSTLLFKIEESLENKILEIICKPYLAVKNKNLNVKIYLNDKYNQSINFDYSEKNKTKKITVLIDHKSIIDNKIVVDFKIENPIAPVEIFESPDSRKLGLLVKSIKLKAI